MDFKNLKGIATGFTDKGKVIYFREGYTFRTLNLPIKDGCLQLKEKGIIVKAWGHSPGALLPLQKSKAIVQLVNAREGDPMDVFKCVDKKQKFSETSVKASAKEQHYKSMNMKTGTNATGLQMVTMCIAVAIFLLVGISWAIQNWRW